MISRSHQLDPKKLKLDRIFRKQIHTDSHRMIIITRTLPLKPFPTRNRSSCSQMSPRPHLLTPTFPLLPSPQCPVHHWRIRCESCQWITTIFSDWTDLVQAVLALNQAFQCCLVSPAQVSIYHKVFIRCTMLSYIFCFTVGVYPAPLIHPQTPQSGISLGVVQSVVDMILPRAVR